MLLVPYIIIIIYLLLFRKRQKKAWIIATCAMILLSITTTIYADLNNYTPLFDYYNSINYRFSFSDTNFIWVLLCKLFYYLGFNYRGMVVGLLFFNYYILHKACQNMQCDENKFFGLFLIFPSIIQLVQLKFFTATTIVVLAYSILLSGKKRSTIMFIVMIIIASLIHNSTIIFLFLLFTKKSNLNKNIIFVASIILAVFLSVNLNRITYLARFFISIQQYDRYVIDTITPSSFLWILLIFISWLISYIFGLLIIGYVKKDNYIEYNSNFEKNIISIILLLMTIPFLLIDRNMHRFLEVGFIILYFMLGAIFKNLKYTKNKLMLLFCLCISLTFVMIVYTPGENVLQPLFSYQSIVNIRR